MSRSCVSAIASAMAGSIALTGCTSDVATSGRHLSPAAGQFQLIGEPDFDWYLSGDRRVAPLQVFSDPWRVWLQWHADQPLPTILVLEAGRWQVAEPQMHGKFSVIDGQWEQLRFQGGSLRADARHGRHHLNAHRRSTDSTRQSSSPSSSQPTPILAKSVQPASRFEVRLEDKYVRQTLMRWAGEHQWHFENSHWAVPVDLPVTAQAAFDGDFISAVRGLLASTDISGRPLQPCFYANRVVRVISANESCDPTSKRANEQ